MTRLLIERELRSGECVAVFKKVNGELRPMTCTLSPNLIPPSHSKRLRSKAPSLSSMSVYDVDRRAWRSFRLDSLVFFDRKRQ